MIIDVDGARHFFDVSHVPHAPALLLMHSIGTSSFIWQDVAARLARRFTVIRPDFRGHGATAVTPGGCTVALLASDMLAICEHLQIEQIHVGGLSLGGLVAQQLALDRPELVASLILCDTGLSIPPATMWRDRASAVRANGVAALGDATIERWVTPGFATTDGGRRLQQILAATPSDGYADAADAIADADFSTRATAIGVPTLVIVGSDDIATPPSLSYALCDTISGARLHLVDGARHITAVEYPDEVAAAIQAFLDKQAQE